MFFFKDDDKVALLGSRMDQLLTACYMQYRHVLHNKMRTDNAASNAKEVSEPATSGSVTAFLKCLFFVLGDEAVPILNHGPHVHLPPRRVDAVGLGGDVARFISRDNQHLAGA